MPWSIADVEKHKKGLNTEQKKLWVKVANAERDRCISKGGKEDVCDAKAIRIANSVVDGVKENEWMSEGYQRKLADDFRKRETEQMKTLKALIDRLKEAGIDEAADLIERAEGILNDKASDFKSRTEMCKEIEEYLARDPEGTPSHIKEGEKEQMFDGDDIVPLNEASVKQPNIPIKIIGPGWGSSGYYKESTLSVGAPKYHKGLHMYWDHPTETEEREQPERSLKNLAAVLVTEGVYKKDGIYGPGIYALCKPFSEFRPKIEEMAAHIGVSHRASGIKKDGEAEGRKGPIIEAITRVHSVDFVTVAGAGGQVAELFESAKDGGAIQTLKTQEEKRMEMEKQLKEAQDALAKEKDNNKTLQEQNEAKDKKLAEIAKQENADKVSAILKEKLDAVTDLPEATKKRIKAEPILKEDGTLDDEKVKEAIDKQIVDERNYLAEVGKKGTVEGMGDGKTDAKTREKLKESLVSRYMHQGEPKEKAEAMAEVFLSKK